jgi:Ion transport protein
MSAPQAPPTIKTMHLEETRANNSDRNLMLSPTESSSSKECQDSFEGVQYDNGFVPGQQKYRFETIGKIREISGAVVNHPHVQKAVIVLICINAIMMGIATFSFVWANPAVNRTFETVDMVFLVIFTIELAMQVLYHGFRLFLDGWLVFDFLVIAISWGFSSMQIIRSFRILRALRLLTRIESMKELVAALLSTMPRMAAITALMSLIFYIFAVMFTQLFKNLPLEEAYFVSLDATLFTLFQMMTLDWASIARECMQYYTWAWFPFVAFIMISSFIVFNLIIAVICDAVSLIGGHGDDEAEEHHQNELKIMEMERQVQTLARQVMTMSKTQEQMHHSMEVLVRQLEITKMRKQGLQRGRILQ